MGLGKTLQTISLIATTLDTAQQFENSQPALSHSSPTEDSRTSHTTLLICPVGLLDTWDKEIEKHTQEGALKVMCWHGANRHKCKTYGHYTYSISINTQILILRLNLFHLYLVSQSLPLLVP
jgi:SNF2 family DNA or RNA helicase